MRTGGALAEPIRLPSTAGLERYCAVAIMALDRQRLGNREVALALNVDRSHFGKIRRGERPMPPRMLSDLIELLQLDRIRLALAVEVMGSAELYFEPSFRNASYYAQGILADLLAIIEQPGTIDRKQMFAALTKERCDSLAKAANHQIGIHLQNLEDFAA